MAKVEVIKCFLDVYDNSIVHNPGEVLDFDASRAAECEARGLIKVLEEEKPKTPKKTKAK